MTTGAERIAIERQRQITDEGWTPEHDQQEHAGSDSLAMAAVAYALPYYWGATIEEKAVTRADFWPWDRKFWKPWRRAAA